MIDVRDAALTEYRVQPKPFQHRMLPAEGSLRLVSIQERRKCLARGRQIIHHDCRAADRRDFAGQSGRQVVAAADVAHPLGQVRIDVYAIRTSSGRRGAYASEEFIPVHMGPPFPSRCHQSRKRLAAGAGKSRLAVQPDRPPGNREIQRLGLARPTVRVASQVARR